MIDQLEIPSHIQVQFVTLFFLEVHNCVAPFYSHRKLHEFGAEKPISWSKLAYFDFLAINCTVSSHILSTGGDALIESPNSRYEGNIVFNWVPIGPQLKHQSVCFTVYISTKEEKKLHPINMRDWLETGVF
jgi:hypothetical protein